MKRYFLLVVILLSITIYFITINLKAEMTLTYFPIDDEQQFTIARSSLTPIDDTHTIEWVSESNSEAKLYLRQDISLLFNNGILFGVFNKWAQHIDNLKQSKQLQVTPNTMLETISFHHGEHHQDGQITSIQQMSSDTLYIFKRGAIRAPHSASDQKKITSLERKINKSLTTHWNELMDYYHIERNKYVQIPLSEIENLRNYFPPTFSDETTNRITGQLWEGLYKNYVLQAIEMKSKDLMPLILLANDHSHLQVLYTMNGEKMKLIQQMGTAANSLTE